MTLVAALLAALLACSCNKNEAREPLPEALVDSWASCVARALDARLAPASEVAAIAALIVDEGDTPMARAILTAIAGEAAPMPAVGAKARLLAAVASAQAAIGDVEGARANAAAAAEALPIGPDVVDLDARLAVDEVAEALARVGLHERLDALLTAAGDGVDDAALGYALAGDEARARRLLARAGGGEGGYARSRAVALLGDDWPVAVSQQPPVDRPAVLREIALDAIRADAPGRARDALARGQVALTELEGVPLERPQLPWQYRSHMAEVARRLGDDRRARELLDEAERGAASLKDFEAGPVVVEIARVRAALGDHAEARRLATAPRADVVSRAGSAHLLIDIATRQGKFVDAHMVLYSNTVPGRALALATIAVRYAASGTRDQTFEKAMAEMCDRR